MEARETKFLKIIEGTNQFLVPHFQRPYTWREPEWDVLWRDILALVDDDDAGPVGRRQHFIGSIVTMPGCSVPEGITKYLLIDGQQRLTTLLVLLAVLRDRARALGHKLADEIQDLYLANRHQDGLDELKLLPTSGEDPRDNDRSAFIAIIRGEDTLRAGTSGIPAARGYFMRQVAEWDAEHVDLVKRIVVGRLVLVSIVLNRDDNPYAIFESLNAKGRPLSQADLIRNLFFMRTHADRHEALYRGKWLPMEARVGNHNMPEYIRHFLMREGSVVKLADVYFTLKSKVDDAGESAVLALLDLLCGYSHHYSLLMEPAREESPAVRVRLARLVRLEATVAYPFLLNVFEERQKGSLSEQSLCDILDAIENFLVRRFVCGEIRAELNKLFPGLFRLARLQKSLVHGTREVLALKSYPQDEVFLRALIEIPLYGVGERRDRGRYILERIEQSFDHREPIELESLTIEHVMPQSLSPWWRGVLGEHCQDLHARWVHSIGNLTLTGYNSELSNSDYASKRDMFQASHVEMNRYFAEVDRWDFDAIGRRCGALARRALGVWPNIAPEIGRGEAAFGRMAGKVPAALWILGARQSVGSWQNVLKCTLSSVLELGGPDFLAELLRQYPKFVSRRPGDLRAPRELREGIFYESNLSADRIYVFCREVSLLASMSYDDFRIEIQPSGQGAFDVPAEDAVQHAHR